MKHFLSTGACINPLHFFFLSHTRLPVLSSPPCSISSSWQPLPGCSWKECSSTSCWWRCLRASTPGPSTSTWQVMECPLSSLPCLPQWTTGAMALTECKDKRVAWKKRVYSERVMDDEFGWRRGACCHLATSGIVFPPSCDTVEASIHVHEQGRGGSCGGKQGKMHHRVLE